MPYRGIIATGLTVALCLLAHPAHAHVGFEPQVCVHPGTGDSREILVIYERENAALPCSTEYDSPAGSQLLVSSQDTPEVCEAAANRVVNELRRGGYRCKMLAHSHADGLSQEGAWGAALTPEERIEIKRSILQQEAHTRRQRESSHAGVGLRARDRLETCLRGPLQAAPSPLPEPATEAQEEGESPPPMESPWPPPATLPDNARRCYERAERDWMDEIAQLTSQLAGYADQHYSRRREEGDDAEAFLAAASAWRDVYRGEYAALAEAMDRVGRYGGATGETLFRYKLAVLEARARHLQRMLELLESGEYSDGE